MNTQASDIIGQCDTCRLSYVEISGAKLGDRCRMKPGGKACPGTIVAPSGPSDTIYTRSPETFSEYEHSNGPITSPPPLKVMHECGATSTYVPDLTQVPYSLIQLAAERFMFGEKRHSRGNWRKGVGDKKYTIDRINHLVKHCYHLAALINEEPTGAAGDDTVEGDLGAIVFGAAFLCESVPLLINKQTTRVASTQDTPKVGE